MKTFFLILSLSLLSCGTSKNSETTNTNQTRGVIVNTDACTTIEVSTGEKMTLYPINLDEKFQKAGLIIMFDYLPSKAPQPTDCKADMVVAISNVSLVKE